MIFWVSTVSTMDYTEIYISYFNIHRDEMIISCTCASRLKVLNHVLRSSSSNVKPKFFKLVVCNPCQSSPSLTILVPLWFIIISLVFPYLSNLLFDGFLYCKGSFVCSQNDSSTVTDWAREEGSHHTQLTLSLVSFNSVIFVCGHSLFGEANSFPRA